MVKYITIAFVLFFMVACGQQQQESQTNEQNDLGTVQLQNSDPAQQENMSNQDKAKYLANVASQVPDVNDATALITNRGVIISIDVNEDLDRSEVGSIKFSVLEAIQHDPYGENAIIVADPDMHERLKGIGDKIQQGHPIEAITEELSNITGRLIPEIPLNEKQSEKIDQNKQKMDEEKDQELENITDEQSNHQKDR
ncbi:MULTISPECIES: YhcN/YlaJ family sporulation lipoprotein [Gracilibacillus]|uniref:YhcN/YlaJ family sporulation lipoprotein n=1 Tax=Gracilibacillus dipsosauri TaxID=178340 RepID=A0A317KZN2_9BACI|nr:YhcN/YlaJ family sporulation lipoprotein [Gracilibacillus dipsosauri]PWU68987.1 hypothetical protein DLJ74_11285 [Gracilibacillus dipsosauri]